MTNTIKLITISAIALMTACNSKSSYLGNSPKKEMDSVSYAIGLQMGQNLKQNGLDSTVNIDLLARGLYEAMNNKKQLFTGDTVTGILMKHFNPQMYAMMKANEEKGKKFFDE